MKLISEIRAANREEFESNFPDCFTEMILGQGPGIRTGYARPFPSKDEKKTAKLKSFLSSAESRILQAVKEKIERMNNNTGYIPGIPFKISERGLPQSEDVKNGYLAALSDLKAYVEEGMK